MEGKLKVGVIGWEENWKEMKTEKVVFGLNSGNEGEGKEMKEKCEKERVIYFPSTYGRMGREWRGSTLLPTGMLS